MSSACFVIGDQVVLKSGGPIMTVQQILGTETGKFSYRCQWFAGKKLDSGAFPENSLVLSEESNTK